jgi:GNAT superfamily N-acetyltransferase
VPKSRFTEQEFRDIAATCGSQAELAKATGLYPTTIWKFVHRYGITFASKYPTKEQLLVDCDIGMSQYNMAAKYRLSNKTIRKLLISYGLKTKFKATTPSGMTKAGLLVDCAAVMSMNDMSIKYGICARAVWARLRYFGIQDSLLNNTDEFKEKYTKRRLDRMAETTKTTMTTPHQIVSDILDALGIVHQNEYIIGEFSFDIFIPDKNILIDIQGDYWHTIPGNANRDKIKYLRTKSARSELVIKYVWEHECDDKTRLLEKIKHMVGLNIPTQFSFSDIKYKISDNIEVDALFSAWHYAGPGRSGFDVGYYLGDELIGAVRFASPSRQGIASSLGYTTGEVLELTRLCIKPSYQIRNFGSWLLSRAEACVKKFYPNIKCLVSFADLAYGHTGAIYKASNWTFVAEVPPNYVYISDTCERRHKKAIWTAAKRAGVTESEYAEQNRLVKVYGLGKFKFKKVLK